MRTPLVKTGLDILVDESFGRLRGSKVGIMAHPASVDSKLRHIVDLLKLANVRPSILFGPEHGLSGMMQDMETVSDEGSVVIQEAIEIVSLYGPSEESLHPKEEQLKKCDVLMVDLQDVGSRYYTFAASMGYAMEVAKRTGTKIMVLDRPNPIGGRAQDIEGPAIDPKFHSFVGAYNIPVRHGLTMGELALYFNKEFNIRCELEVVSMQGWTRDMDFESSGLPWVLPSPNMPTVDTAWVYPGQCLFEGTNLSEGRGTTRPFELVGAPFLDPYRWADLAQKDAGPGVHLRPTYIKPTFHKFGGKDCGAIQVHVTDRWSIRPLRVGLALLKAAQALAPADFKWRTETYEYVSDRLAIDLLLGSSQIRLDLEKGVSIDQIVTGFGSFESEFAERRKPYLLYS